VDTLADVDNGDFQPGDLSLREAIGVALPGDNLLLDSLNGAITLDPSTDVLEFGLITIERSVGIFGPGADLLAISGGGQTPALLVLAANAQLVVEGIRFEDCFDTAALVDRGG